MPNQQNIGVRFHKAAPFSRNVTACSTWSVTMLGACAMDLVTPGLTMQQTWPVDKSSNQQPTCPLVKSVPHRWLSQHATAHPKSHRR